MVPNNSLDTATQLKPALSAREIEGMSLPEGSMVAVLARGADEPFELSPEDEDELLAAISEIERGEFVRAEELLRDLPG